MSVGGDKINQKVYEYADKIQRSSFSSCRDGFVLYVADDENRSVVCFSLFENPEKMQLRDKVWTANYRLRTWLREIDQAVEDVEFLKMSMDKGWISSDSERAEVEAELEDLYHVIAQDNAIIESTVKYLIQLYENNKKMCVNQTSKSKCEAKKDSCVWVDDSLLKLATSANQWVRWWKGEAGVCHAKSPFDTQFMKPQAALGSLKNMVERLTKIDAKPMYKRTIAERRERQQIVNEVQKSMPSEKDEKTLIAIGLDVIRLEILQSYFEACSNKKGEFDFCTDEATKLAKQEIKDIKKRLETANQSFTKVWQKSGWLGVIAYAFDLVKCIVTLSWEKVATSFKFLRSSYSSALSLAKSVEWQKFLGKMKDKSSQLLRDFELSKTKQISCAGISSVLMSVSFMFGAVSFALCGFLYFWNRLMQKIFS